MGVHHAGGGGGGGVNECSGMGQLWRVCGIAVWHVVGSTLEGGQGSWQHKSAPLDSGRCKLQRPLAYQTQGRQVAQAASMRNNRDSHKVRCQVRDRPPPRVCLIVKPGQAKTMDVSSAFALHRCMFTYFIVAS